MKLFHEVENKYYELLTLMINKKRKYTDKEIGSLLETQLVGEIDFDVVDSLFSKKEGEEAVYLYENSLFRPVINASVPVLNTKLEQETIVNALRNPYARHFLNPSTMQKLKIMSEGFGSSWDDRSVFIRNQFEHGSLENARNNASDIKTISKAIKEHRAIRYDNVKPGKFEFRGAEIYPVKIEYSFINDMFRISGFENKEQRFIKMNLVSMSNIELLDKEKDGLEAEYKDFIETNTVSVTLDVDPKDHVIERCFRIFSYYNRKARYDEEADKYRLEISYLNSDEAEIVRDILSLGCYVVVLEPRKLQKEVYRRIKIANERYIVN